MRKSEVKLIVDERGRLQSFEGLVPGQVIELYDRVEGSNIGCVKVYTPTVEDIGKVMMAVYNRMNIQHRDICAFALGKFEGDKVLAIDWLKMKLSGC